jgi:hypothetical protein
MLGLNLADLLRKTKGKDGREQMRARRDTRCPAQGGVGEDARCKNLGKNQEAMDRISK